MGGGGGIQYFLLFLLLFLRCYMNSFKKLFCEVVDQHKHTLHPMDKKYDLQKMYSKNVT